MRVVVTAGHVDHGKSALVRGLTGMEPDRFAEERARGLTIDLGFAWTDLPDGTTVAFVDVPGHERFIANMLAGAGSCELALLVIAADEGWMPQSTEHQAILDLLGVRHAVVALTKVDRVDDETVELAAEEIRDALADSPLATAPIVPCSATDGTGLAEVRGALAGLLASAPAPRDDERPRLWLDRAFTVRGAGTVVTGTLAGGSLRVGEEVAVLPQGAGATRIRGLQMLGEQAEVAPPGSRVAVNLVGVDRDAVARGDALVRPGQWQPTHAVDVRLRTLSGWSVERRGAWHAHLGTAQRTARVLPTAAGAISGEGTARLELDGPVVAAAGDRLILREAGAWETVAGGEVLDPHPPPRPRGRAAREQRGQELARRASALARDDDAALLAAHLAERRAAPQQTTAGDLGLANHAPARLAEPAGAVTLGGGWLADPTALDAWREEARAAAARAHRERPLAAAAPRDVVDRAVHAAGCPEGALGAVRERLLAEGTLIAVGSGVALPEHRVTLTDEQDTARDALLARLRAAPLSPPRLSEAAAEAGADDALVGHLVESGVLVRLADDVAVPAEAVDDAAQRLRALHAQAGPFTAAAAKDALGTTRRVAVPLLELLDRRGVTRREGDQRVCP